VRLRAVGLGSALQQGAAIRKTMMKGKNPLGLRKEHLR